MQRLCVMYCRNNTISDGIGEIFSSVVFSMRHIVFRAHFIYTVADVVTCNFIIFMAYRKTFYRYFAINTKIRDIFIFLKLVLYPFVQNIDSQFPVCSQVLLQLNSLFVY